MNDNSYNIYHVIFSFLPTTPGSHMAYGMHFFILRVSNIKQKIFGYSQGRDSELGQFSAWVFANSSELASFQLSCRQQEL